jgi:uncharacterized protein YecT (DUF1311 family)
MPPRRLIVALVGAASLTAFVPAGSASAAASKAKTPANPYPACVKSATSESDMEHCYGAELQQLQGQLSAALKRSYSILGTKAVKATQAQWVKYQRSECNLEASVNNGGSIVPLDVISCELQLTAGRIDQVRQILTQHAVASTVSAAARAKAAAAVAAAEAAAAAAQQRLNHK